MAEEEWPVVSEIAAQEDREDHFRAVPEEEVQSQDQNHQRLLPQSPLSDDLKPSTS